MCQKRFLSSGTRTERAERFVSETRFSFSEGDPRGEQSAFVVIKEGPCVPSTQHTNHPMRDASR